MSHHVGHRFRIQVIPARDQLENGNVNQSQRYKDEPRSGKQRVDRVIREGDTYYGEDNDSDRRLSDESSKEAVNHSAREAGKNSHHHDAESPRWSEDRYPPFPVRDDPHDDAAADAEHHEPDCGTNASGAQSRSCDGIHWQQFSRWPSLAATPHPPPPPPSLDGRVVS